MKTVPEINTATVNFLKICGMIFSLSFLILISCKDDGKSPTEPVDENSVEQAISASSGGTLVLKDNIKLIIPSNALPSNGSVFLGITGKEPKSVPNDAIQVIGQSLTIKFPTESISKTVQLQFPKPDKAGTGENYMVVIYNGTTYLPLEASIVGSTVIVNIDVIDWETNLTTLTSNMPMDDSGGPEKKQKVMVDSEPESQFRQLSKPVFFKELIILNIINKQTPPPTELGLKEISFQGSVLSFTTPIASSNSKIIVFIHGCSSRPSVWESFITRVKNNFSFGYTDIWTFGYNSSFSVETNAQTLYDKLTQFASGKKVDLVCHSMGGLIARAMIEKNNGSGFVNKLITIATPHSGAPVAALRGYIGNLIGQDLNTDKEQAYYQIHNYLTPGFSDLQAESKLIADLSALTKPVVPYYCIAAINKVPTYFTSAEQILPGGDDGLVTETSALGVNQKTDSKSITIPNIAAQASHTLVPVSDEIFNQVKTYLQTTFVILPTVTTNTVTDITFSTAICGGTVVSDGGAPVTARGVCWSTNSNPKTSDFRTDNGTGTGSFISSLTGLTDNTTYYVRAYAINSVGIAYGKDEIVFTTQEKENSIPNIPFNPSPGTGAINQPTSITLSWNCSDPDGDGLVYDVYFGDSGAPTALISANQTSTSLIKNGLTNSATYYWKVVAKDGKGGVTEGPVWNFSTLGTLLYNGVTYHTVKIGNQIWTVENLRTTKYNDGSEIPKVVDNGTWGGLTSDAFCAYENDEKNVDSYGYLYNWYAVNTGKLAPSGWRVPSDEDWVNLENTVGGFENAGAKLKATSGWNNDGNGSDDYGFCALPGGVRVAGSGVFTYLGQYGNWWSSTVDKDQVGVGYAFYRSIVYFSTSLHRQYFVFRQGFSVRLVRDL